MTTIILHGTLGKGAKWYWDSWKGRGFCHAVELGMKEVRSDFEHDIWRVKGKHVSEVKQLQQKKWNPWRGMPKDLASVEGRFEWTGTPEGLARGTAAIWLVKYLNRLRKITDEPIRIIAHSHGCNVVKLASSLKDLSPNVEIEKAVFLACPHFYEKEFTSDKPQEWTDKFDIKKQTLKESGLRFRYRANPDRFGKILNVYCEQDAVQVDIADTWSGTYAPQTGGFFENLSKMYRTLDVYELPEASRTDLDPDSEHLYEDLEVHVEKGCSGIQSHSVLHGAVVGRFIGRWLNSIDSDQLGNLPEIPCDDIGE